MTLLIAFALVCVAAADLQGGLNPGRPRWPRLPEGVKPMDDSKIVGGATTTIDKFPYQVAMYKDGNFICGGELIRTNVVLTAAHCVHRYENSPSRFEIRVGSTTYSGGTRHRVSRVNKHSSYNSYTTDYDVATMILSSSVSINTYTQLVTMASGGSSYSGYTGTVSGWGTTSEDGNISRNLRYVNVAIMSNVQCADVLGSGVITNRMMCAGYPDGGKDACQGDSGGPLVINHSMSNPSNSVLVGIVSWGYGCARPQSPGIYSRVTVLRGWIDAYS
ncbi:PREDICTED: trypsin alpha-like [Priapulus caudatus]|uniref:Trypsin alpha-like n=1 Tax=Priapulus caudatus TaxID=37621 RepID=A0ABM1DSW7_PRICU|nr:PREDICTED: trypsin alpha-like [Priapulus caudatus]XP_014663038.1 PREDICTED: trypsin alpha-like [Priapulus caudatus]